MPRQHGPWGPNDEVFRGENYEMNNVELYNLGLHLTLDASGRVLVIKRRVQRGVSQTLYKYTGPIPQLQVPPKEEQH